MSTNNSKTTSVRLEQAEVDAIEAHMGRLKARDAGIPYNFSDALKSLLSLGILAAQQQR